MTLSTPETFTLHQVLSTAPFPKVNLLPPELAQERALKRSRVVAAAIVGVAVVATTGACIAAIIQTQDNEAGVQELQEQQVNLQQQIGALAHVPATIAKVEAAQAAQEQVLARDVLWYRYLADLALTYPDNVTVDQLQFSLGGPAQSVPWASGGVGNITVTGKAKDYKTVAAWLDTLDNTQGFVGGTYAQSTKGVVNDKEVVNFTSSAVVNQQAFSHRYDRKAQ